MIDDDAVHEMQELDAPSRESAGPRRHWPKRSRGEVEGEALMSRQPGCDLWVLVVA